MCINKNAELLPYYQKAKELLNYDPENGEFSWRVKRSNNCRETVGSLSTTGYRYVSIRVDNIRKNLHLHRLAWFFYYGYLPDIIDHIDGDRSNNSINNLRSCTQQQNTFNRGKQRNNTSGYKGVSWNKKDSVFTAGIKYNQKRIHIGSFKCPKKASEAYEAKAKELFGEFYNSPLKTQTGR